MGACTGLLAGKTSFAMAVSYKHKMFMKSAAAFSYKKRLGISWPLFIIYFSSFFSHNSILSCYHLSSCHAAISAPLTISSTMELSYLQT
jgi:hypothetical protein